ncbi:MAG TPA: UDP-3-O-acyl-N-acetylglucosamine deacetylase [Stellaceae bacterium]|nr:UDP-3-O-acyl-N-acetylglucosamine deacetylase [Stellaceae bacterium]
MLKPAAALQKTVKASIPCTGVGLHTGVKTTMTLLPAAEGTGIVFRRIDGPVPIEIPALWNNAIESALCTTLRDTRGNSIMTIEHLMAALSGCGIDNVIVELDGPEVPIMDGSAEPFVFLIECAGIAVQTAPRLAIKVLKTVSVGDGLKSASLEADHVFAVDMDIDFPNRIIAQQSTSLVLDPMVFKEEVSRARTFGFLNEVDQMRAAGLARGGSLENAIVVSGDVVLNKDGLRYVDEFVRHKALDAIGDLYLAGGPILGRFRGVRSSHALNRRLLEALFADRDAWCYAHVTEAADFSQPWEQPLEALSA